MNNANNSGSSEYNFTAVTNETGEYYLGEYISATGEVAACRIFINDTFKSKLKNKK